VETIGITVTGRVADEPYRGTTSSGQAMTALNLEVSVPPASYNADPVSRWLRVVAFGALASRVGDSIRAGDRVTVRASDLSCRAWVNEATGKPAARITLRAYDIAASMLTDTLTTGQAVRRDTFRAAASGQPTSLPAAEQADAAVLAGVTR
jgi:single-stranded DNA-binding protein